MLRYLLVFLFLFSFSWLEAADDAEVLKRAQGFVQSKNKSDQFRAYNDFKNLYLRAIMNEDERLKASALRGIVKSGKALHIDVSQYSSELADIDETTFSSSYNPPTSKTIESQKVNEHVKVQSSHKLKAITWEDERLILKFDKKLRDNQINYFTLHDSKKRQYRYIFDIHASMLTRSENLKKEGIDRIKLAQYNPNTLRLVIEHHHKINVRFKKEEYGLVINIENAQLKQKVPTAPQPPKRLSRDKVVVIDAGHGGKDPGAVGYRGYREKIIVQQIAEKVKKILHARGYKVYLTRERDIFVKLSSRTKFANAKNADIFLSIHANAIGGKNANKVHGIETYFLSTSRSARAKKVAALENSADLSDMNFYGKESFLNTLNSHNIVASNKLAIDLQQGMLSSLSKNYKNVKDMGVREGPFWVLVGAQMPSVLIEVGFITHPTEAKRLVNTKYQQSLAQGLADGVERYFVNSERR
jgi:N-acetylmuramoyl-L-alanine amidase